MDVEISFRVEKAIFFPLLILHTADQAEAIFTAKLLESSHKEQESPCTLTLNQFQKHSLIWYEYVPRRIPRIRLVNFPCNNFALEHSAPISHLSITEDGLC